MIFTANHFSQKQIMTLLRSSRARLIAGLLLLEHSMDFAEAFVMLEHAVAFHECKDLDIPEAFQLMQFAADTLGLQCPPKLPRICIDDEMAGKVLGNFVVSIKIITLKSWNGSARDQGILIHELSHAIQQFNSVPFCEEQAEMVRHAWLETVA